MTQPQPYTYKNNRYLFITEVKMKINGEWADGMLYTKPDGGEYYMREAGDFKTKFKKEKK